MNTFVIFAAMIALIALAGLLKQPIMRRIYIRRHARMMDPKNWVMRDGGKWYLLGKKPVQIIDGPITEGTFDHEVLIVAGGSISGATFNGPVTDAGVAAEATKDIAMIHRDMLQTSDSRCETGVIVSNIQPRCFREVPFAVAQFRRGIH